MSSSVFVEGCRECVFVVACQQLRIHTTTLSAFYVHVTSRSIIEDCSTVTFAPYSWSYPQLDEHFKVCFMGVCAWVGVIVSWKLFNCFSIACSNPNASSCDLAPMQNAPHSTLFEC